MCVGGGGGGGGGAQVGYLPLIMGVRSFPPRKFCNKLQTSVETILMHFETFCT